MAPESTQTARKSPPGTANSARGRLFERVSGRDCEATASNKTGSSKTSMKLPAPGMIGI